MREPSASEGPAGPGAFPEEEAPAAKEARSFQPFLHSHKMLTRVLQSTLDGIMAFGAVREDGRIVDFEWRMANPVAAEAIGRGEEALVGQRLLTVFPDLRGTDLFGAGVRVVETGEPLRRELHHTREKHEEDGTPQGWFRVSAVRLGDGLAVTFQDVTERKKAVEALRKSEERFRMMAENISDLVCLHEPDGTCIFASPSLKRILDYEPDEIQGRRPPELAHPDDEERVRVALERTREGERVTEQVRLRHRDGSYRYVETACRPIFDSEGRVLRLLTSTRDVTERVEAEKGLERTNAELRLRNRELQDFAHIASHDLQEPLRKVRAFAGLMREDYDDIVDETGRYYLERMQDGAERMARLVSDLLSLSRVTTKGDPFETVDLNAIAASVRLDLEMRIEETGGRVEIGELPDLEADPTQMRQLLQNLIGNALKFHREGVPPVVRVRAARETVADESADTGVLPGVTEVCRLTVEDNGIGFEEKFLDRIFTPLQRLHGRSEYEGTGIGLAVCRRIAERHGGTIRAESKPGAGSCFTVLLPLQQPPPNEADDIKAGDGTSVGTQLEHADPAS